MMKVQPVMENLPEASFGLSEIKKNSQKFNNSHKVLGVYLGLAVIVLFLGLVSLAPQISKRFGEVAQKKESQESLAVLSAPCTGPSGGYGDVDGTSGVTSVDALLIQRYVAGLSTSIPFTDAVKKRADVDGDRKVSAVDSLLILRYVSALNMTFPMCMDHDTDSFADPVETYVGTGPYASCGTNNWPADFDNNKTINSADVTTINAKVGASEGSSAYSKRYDLNLDGKIDQSDVALVNNLLNKSCTIAAAPSVTLNVMPSTILVNQNVSLSWSSSNAIAPCDASTTPNNLWSGQKATSGSTSVKITSAGSYTFTLKCYGPGGVKEVPTTIKVNNPPCTGTPVLSLSPTSVTYGGSVRATASGLSNCTSADKVDFKISQNNNWTQINSCRLASGSSCYIDFAANYQSGQMIAFLDAGANGTLEASSNQIFLTINPAQAAAQNEPKGWPTLGEVRKWPHPCEEYCTGYVEIDIHDFNNAVGKPVYATFDGKITYIYESFCGTGLVLENSSYRARYCHLNSRDVVNGQQVTFRTPIGTVGQSGYATSGPHLHYAVRDPVTFNQPWVPFTPFAGARMDSLDDSNGN